MGTTFDDHCWSICCLATTSIALSILRRRCHPRSEPTLKAVADPWKKNTPARTIYLAIQDFSVEQHPDSPELAIRYFEEGIGILKSSASDFVEKSYLEMGSTLLKNLKKTMTLEHRGTSKATAYVASALDTSRFGDQLISHFNAFWVSSRYRIEMVYRPFDFSDQLSLSKAHPVLFNNRDLQTYTKKRRFKGDVEAANKLFREKPKENTLFLVSFFSQVFDDWEDEDFRKKLGELVKPLIPIKPFHFPKGHVSVAMHVRKGGGFDSQTVIESMRTKFPPNSFYLNGLKQLADHFNNLPLYLHIFTDDPHPVNIREKFEQEIKKWGIKNPIQFGCRVSDNRHDANVLEDFFAMMECDCMIRPNSSFSQAAAAVSGPIFEVTPLAWDNYRKDSHGNPLKDREGNPIVDNLVTYRPGKGKKRNHNRIAKIEDAMLF